MEVITMATNLGTIRGSQLIYHYGPGSIADLKEGTVMPLAVDKWNLYNAVHEVDKRITNVLKIDHVKLISEESESLKVRAVRFPKWQICPSCGMMTEWDQVHCYYCKKNSEKEIDLYPSRFVVACQAGHIQDFPYYEVIHKGETCTHSKPLLKLTHLGNSGSLSDMVVECVRCKKKERLGKIMRKNEMKKYMDHCKGERPWLLDQVNCTNPVETHLRGATYLYSPSIVSFLKIPLMEMGYARIESFIRDRQEDLALEETIDEKRSYLKKYGKMSADEIDYALILLNGEQEQISYESIRKQEWRTLDSGTVNDLHNTGYKATAMPIHESLMHLISNITRIDSMPEIKVLQGFSRMDYSDRFDVQDRDKLLPVTSNKNINWLPGIKNIGEGIFIKFSEDALQQWESQLGESYSGPIEKFNEMRNGEGLRRMDYSLRHMMIHTFSHALIEEFSAHSGYPTTSLQERMYCGDGMYGVLIYTASGDAEGSLGGLINLADSEKIKSIVMDALERIVYCSADPLCSDVEHGLHSTANGAACHSCSYLSEVSCEWGNVLLDRRLLRTINPHEKTGYFDELFVGY